MKQEANDSPFKRVGRASFVDPKFVDIWATMQLRIRMEIKVNSLDPDIKKTIRGDAA
jgi:hypothetical protein